ncbi:hypothetical protein AC482_01535 [miscellaneous Crenarchaeota group-15 archaeon DG-45]|uniref:Uncharacterized protein n=1 Tax=miscellaneous Crenarchaeota group-15 archaeon DG-45 TaxID=1685127 RepID=A0A0M0BRI8_9ARCH|nr:MAG: hypothetical protein AC482_01535 [miscellaneous Crenarchaeota group-15 archaeon DG-45]
MRIRAGAVASAVITLAVFAVLPLALPALLPPDLTDAISLMGFDLPSLLNEVAIIGVVLSAIALARGLVEKTSPAYPALSAVSNVGWLAFSLLVLGLGEIGTLGVTELSFEVPGGVNAVVFDMQLFVYIAVVAVGLKIIHSVLEFLDARSSTKDQRKERGE